MIRKRFLSSLITAPMAVLMLTTSCNNSYPGIYYEPDEDVPSNNEDLNIEATPIKIYTRNPAFFSLSTRGTRGTGAFDNTDTKMFDNATFHVFAFRAGTGADGTGGQGTLTMPVDLTYTAYSPNHEAAGDRLNSSCLIDGEDRNLGMPFKFLADGSTIVGSDSQYGTLEPKVDYKVYYSGTYQDIGYNFFGYYIDDWKPTSQNTTRAQDHITYHVDLDGNRDLLYGHADQLKVADFEKDGAYYDLNLPKEEVDRILGMAGGYSTYSGHRNVHPVIRMKHALTQLVFQAYPGNVSANRVRITGIDVEAAKTANMKVAGRKYDECGIESFSDEKSTFKLCDRKTTPDDNGVYPINTNGFNTEYRLAFDESAEKQEVTRLGTSLLVAPAKNYKVTLHYTFEKEGTLAPNEDRYAKFDAVYYLSAPENDGVSVDANGNRMFMPGVMYNIKIGVFGLEKIVMDSAVEGWTDGGGIVVDPDNDDYTTPPAEVRRR